MLKTETPVSAYQLSRMLRVLPRTSKKTSPSRGSGAASEADMPPMLTPLRTSVQFIQSIARDARVWASRRGRSCPAQICRDTPQENAAPPCADGGRGGIMVRRLSCPRLLGPAVFRGTPSYGTHRLSGNTVWWGRRLSCMSQPACEHYSLHTVRAR